MKNFKAKLITAAIATAVFSAGYSISASADSVTSPTNQPQTVTAPLHISNRMNVEFQGGSGGYWTNTSKLTYIQNTASGVLYYDRVNHKYVFSQTRGAMGAAIYVFNAQGVNW